jgi:hypothetical protein
MTRWKIAAVALVAAVSAVTVTACVGRSGTGQDSAVDLAAMGSEGEALAALGFDVQYADLDDATATPTDAASTDPTAGRGEGWRKRHQARVLLRKNLLHGEVVVQTRDGTKTIVAQRGTVTAVDGSSMTVRSTDGFTLTWTFGENLRVVEHGTRVQVDRVQVGALLGVAGAKDGERSVARLIVIPKK